SPRFPAVSTGNQSSPALQQTSFLATSPHIFASSEDTSNDKQFHDNLSLNLNSGTNANDPRCSGELLDQKADDNETDEQQQQSASFLLPTQPTPSDTAIQNNISSLPPTPSFVSPRQQASSLTTCQDL
ncbi:unnamed protein product, partial [Didymodactylos carnosus]